MSAASSDRNLLFGVLALQMDFLSRDALIAVMHAWIQDKAKPLGDILVEQEALRPNERDAIDVLVQKHLDRHQGDIEKSLAAVNVPAPLREELRSLADPDVQASLPQCQRLPNPISRVRCPPPCQRRSHPLVSRSGETIPWSSLCFAGCPRPSMLGERPHRRRGFAP